MRLDGTQRLVVAAVAALVGLSPLSASAVQKGGSIAGPTGPARVLRFDGPGGGQDYSTAIAVAGDGSRFFVSGYAYGGLARGDDYTTIAYGPRGHRLWTASYNGPDSNIDEALGVAVTPDGDAVFVTGYSFGGPSTTNDATTIAYDGATGAELWVARYDGPGHDTDVGVDLAVAPDGQTVYVTGASIGDDGMLDVLTISYDSVSGEENWATRSAGSGGASDEGLSIGVSPDGARVYVTGYQTGTTVDMLTVTYSAATGTELWSRTIDTGGDEIGKDLVLAPDGSSVYVTGYRSGAPGGGSRPLACLSGRAGVGDDYVTVAYNAATGQRRWIMNYDGPDHDCDEAYGIAVAPGGSAVFVTGSSFSIASDSDAATVAYGTADGAQLWEARFDGPDHLYDTGDSLVVSPDSGLVYVAGLSSDATTDYDFMTLFYNVTTSDLVRSERYDGPGQGFDAPNAIGMHPTGRLVYVTGGSLGSDLNVDFATAIYPT